jgi:AP-1-like factor
MDYNAPTSSLWDFSQSSSTFSQLAENDFIALFQKQFNPQFTPDLSTSNPFPIPHDSVDPSKITNLASAAPPPPLSDESSPSPPSTTDRLSSSRRQSTNSAVEHDENELKRKASVDAFEEDNPSLKTCMSLLVANHLTHPLRNRLAKKSPARRKSGSGQVSATRLHIIQSILATDPHSPYTG